MSHSLANGLTVAQLEACGGAPPNVTGFTSKLRTPLYQEWNFQIQRELDSKSRLTVAYVGNHGIFEAYPNSWGNASSGFGDYRCPRHFSLGPIRCRYPMAVGRGIKLQRSDRNL